ncbi:hypothetical protein [Anaeromyxobacter oryzae]|uniref:Uncharacterized protein n=1 Tax=Anaeromyxobacter oryzae TaxID=2918170 RepID=A0ABM7X1K3_9BACT|nr:hypothetical protein [Anaeromyxobacter oryzae]BDG05673.1 hypothetical protein AMOR_46690 [Anaeromyxobacter oryzae]
MFHARIWAAGMLAPAIAIAAPVTSALRTLHVAEMTSAGGNQPAGQVDRCLARHLRVPADMAEHLPDRTDLWLHVNRSGEVRGVHAADVATKEITPYIREALGKCDWHPLAGDEVDLKLRFEP